MIASAGRESINNARDIRENGMIRTGWMALAFGMALIGTADAQSDLVKRGDYLVNGLLTCGNCHTPKGPTGDIMEKAFSGGLTFDEPPFKVTAPNITPDKETGIGNWTDAQIKTLMRKGVRPNGVQAAMIMPSDFYEIMTERDLNAVVAYLRTLKPIKNKVADPVYKMQQMHHPFPGGEKPYTEAMMRDKLKKGFYLATIAHCMECHTPTVQGRTLYGEALGKGGKAFLPSFVKGFPAGWRGSTSPNITSHAAAGLGGWTDTEIARAITRGVSRDGRALGPPMGYHWYAGLNAEDVAALVAWLRTVPARD